MVKRFTYTAEGEVPVIRDLAEAARFHRFYKAVEAALKDYRQVAEAQVSAKGKKADTASGGVSYTLTAADYKVRLTVAPKKGAIDVGKLKKKFNLSDEDIDACRYPTKEVSTLKYE